jgi:hypothetical protein
LADIVTSRIFIDGEHGITAAKLNDIVASSVIQPAFYTGKPTASTADPADVMLILKSGAYTQVPVSTLANSISNAQIWSTRLRSFNALGNPNFEVDQRNVGSSQTNPASGVLVLDRWMHGKLGTLAVNVGQQAAALPDICVPSTSFRISRSFYRVTLTTAQASLGTTDNVRVFQNIEGPQWRELSNDVHSLQVLVRSSVANLQFAIALSDPATISKSLVKLATIPSANTWTLLTFPNLPIWPSGNFSALPGVPGYLLSITLAAGANLIAPAADTWQSGNFFGAPGMSNFAASAVNSTFDIAFVQHEPGPVCSILMDKPFDQNLFECQRYFSKTYDYGTAVASTSVPGMMSLSNVVATIAANFGGIFRRTMAKTPTVSIFDHNNGALNSIMDASAVHHTVTAVVGTSTESPFYQLTTSSLTVGSNCWAHYKADTGW